MRGALLLKQTLNIGIACNSALGGSGVVATELGKALAHKGHTVHFITHEYPFRLDEAVPNIFFHPVKVKPYDVLRSPPYDFALATRIAEVAKSQKLDVLHVHYAVPYAICAFLAKKLLQDKLKMVTTLHGTDITVLGQDRSLQDLILLSIQESDAVTAVSCDLIKEAKQLLHIDRSIDLTYNFIDKKIYYPRDVSKLRTKFALPQQKIMMHISNFRPVKRTQDVIDIFRRVQQQCACRLLFVGEGPCIPIIKAQIHNIGLADKVHFIGKQDNIAKIICLADVLLLPSDKESFGLVALEAMACGVPTVGSDTGGIPEVVVHGKTGFLAPVGHTEQMAQHVVHLFTDKVIDRTLRKQCIQRAGQHFCKHKITNTYESIYYRVLNK